MHVSQIRILIWLDQKSALLRKRPKHNKGKNNKLQRPIILTHVRDKRFSYMPYLLRFMIIVQSLYPFPKMCINIICWAYHNILYFFIEKYFFILFLFLFFTKFTIIYLYTCLSVTPKDKHIQYINFHVFLK